MKVREANTTQTQNFEQVQSFKEKFTFIDSTSPPKLLLLDKLLDRPEHSVPPSLPALPEVGAFHLQVANKRRQPVKKFIYKIPIYIYISPNQQKLRT